MAFFPFEGVGGALLNSCNLRKLNIHYYIYDNENEIEIK